VSGRGCFYSQQADLLRQLGTELSTKELVLQDSQIGQQAVDQMRNNQLPPILGFIPWGHHIAILTHCKSVNEALFYKERLRDMASDCRTMSTT
jgi:hypothetical protein